MEIQLNGQHRTIEAGSSLSDLLRSEGLAERRVAVEVNGEIVPRGLHPSQRLQAGDRIEIVHALGGG
ncbi:MULTISPECIES: sulfur carrier protein ThiS [Pseudoxanthomonas]|uniref:sulfur carrier protein ThiS n=1 Tax=Pseudoxanthomonas TaxID=83618 RepID=UPI000887CD44|nr:MULTISPECIES: sulfur carrier protein ThiS [Pseudoxanthomonas]KAF1712830.1 sulfur carrier protein ThiS [Pseudoxanthomonas sacheonensis]SDQ56516.1 sulfur carrier protein [Pseudoxanthomonas sp. CF125]